MVSPVSNQVANPLQDVFQARKEKHHQAQVAKTKQEEQEKARQQEKLDKAEKAEQAEKAEKTAREARDCEELIETMFAVDNPTFLELAKSYPEIPAEFLKTSKGINNFLQRFFFSTEILNKKILDTEYLRCPEESSQWTQAFTERGQNKEPIDVELSHLYLTRRGIQKITQLLPNIRSFKINEYLYDDTKKAEEIQQLFQEQLKGLTQLEMTGGHFFDPFSFIQYRAGATIALELMKGKRFYASLGISREEQTKIQDVLEPLVSEDTYCQDEKNNLIVKYFLKHEKLPEIAPIRFNRHVNK